MPDVENSIRFRVKVTGLEALNRVKGALKDLFSGSFRTPIPKGYERWQFEKAFEKFSKDLRVQRGPYAPFEISERHMPFIKNAIKGARTANELMERFIFISKKIDPTHWKDVFRYLKTSYEVLDPNIQGMLLLGDETYTTGEMMDLFREKAGKMSKGLENQSKKLSRAAWLTGFAGFVMQTALMRMWQWGVNIYNMFTNMIKSTANLGSMFQIVAMGIAYASSQGSKADNVMNALNVGLGDLKEHGVEVMKMWWAYEALLKVITIQVATGLIPKFEELLNVLAIYAKDREFIDALREVGNIILQLAIDFIPAFKIALLTWMPVIRGVGEALHMWMPTIVTLAPALLGISSALMMIGPLLQLFAAGAEGSAVGLGVLTGASGPLIVLLAALAALLAAYTFNWFGFRDAVNAVGAELMKTFGVWGYQLGLFSQSIGLTNTLNGATVSLGNSFAWLGSILSDRIAFQAQLTVAIIRALRGEIDDLINIVYGPLGPEVKTMFERWADEAYEWGQNFMEEFILGAGSKVKDFADALASLGDILKGESPPKKGPLRHIDIWGMKVGQAYVQGFQRGLEGMTTVIETPRVSQSANATVFISGPFQFSSIEDMDYFLDEIGRRIAGETFPKTKGVLVR